VKEITAYNFFSALKKLPYIKRIYLYGSRASKRYMRRTDIDLAIECPTASDQQWDHILTIIEKADTLLEIDCVRFDAIQDEKFRKSILENHRTLFDQEMSI